MEMEKSESELTLYNTMTQLKQVFKPINPGKIGMYVCGITSYDFSHIGHARVAVSFDLLYRYLRHLGYEVTYVRNFTDVDDKVIDRANKRGENPLALSSRFCEEYLDHAVTLNNVFDPYASLLYRSLRTGVGMQWVVMCSSLWINHQITVNYLGNGWIILKLSAQYRSPLNYSVSQLESSSEALCCVYQTLEDLVKALSPYREEMSEGVGKAVQTAEAEDIIKRVKSEFETKMSNDLNTAHILTGAFQDAMKFINVSITKLKKMQKKQRMSLVVPLVEVEKAVRGVLDVLGLLTNLSYTEFLKEMKQKALTRAEIEEEEEVLRRIEERKMARKNKDFKRSDQIRESLAAKGIALEDIGGDTVWRPCTPLILRSKLSLGKIAFAFAIVFIFLGFFFYSR